MKTFLIWCIPCLPIGLFMAFLISAGVKKAKARVALTLGLAVLITALFGGMFTLEEYGNQEVWNNGQCECGGTYDFVNASRYRNNTSYYWECNTCGRIIKTNRNMRG